MAYDYEKNVVAEIKELGARYKAPSFYAMADEVEEVYAKAKAFDEIVIETTGAIMNCPPGVVEAEVGKLTLDIIDKYEKTNGGQINEQPINNWSIKRITRNTKGIR